MFKNLKHIKDWNFYEKISSLIVESFLTVIALFSDIPEWSKNIIGVFIVVYFIYTLIRLKKIYDTHTKNIFYKSNEIKEYMKNWVNNDGHTVIISRDLSWVNLNGDTYNILLAKAKKHELSIILKKHSQCAYELKKSGAEIYDYSEIDFTPENRFTFIHYGRSNPRLAIGYQDGDARIIKEFDKSGAIEYSLAEDLCTLLKKVSKK